jgi:hypothetical protein
MELATVELDTAPPAPTSVSDSTSALGFEDLKLHVGARVQLQPPAHLGKERYTVRLLGWKSGVSVLTEAPIASSGLRIAIRENDPIIVRAFSGRNAFGFTSPVRRVSSYPFEYLHLAWPNRIEGMVVRKVPRVRMRAIANVALADGSTTAATLVNLSATGAGIESAKPLGARGDRMTVSFRLPLHQFSATLGLTAEIRAEIRPDDESARTDVNRYGIEFVELQPDNAIYLQSYVYQRLVEDPAALA